MSDVKFTYKEPEPVQPAKLTQANDVVGFFKVVDAAPTKPPATSIDQIVIAHIGAFIYLYIWDIQFNTWRRLQF